MPLLRIDHSGSLRFFYIYYTCLVWVMAYSWSWFFPFHYAGPKPQAQVYQTWGPFPTEPSRWPLFQC